MVISPLRRKVLRDLRRLWAQVLAIALVLVRRTPADRPPIEEALDTPDLGRQETV